MEIGGLLQKLQPMSWFFFPMEKLWAGAVQL
jgi:hypothetical protein